MRIKFSVLLIFAIPGLFQGAIAQNSNENYSWDHLPVVQRPVFKSDTFNIKKFGAKADGTTLNTQQINDAINACNASGGGVVLIPSGLWLSGPITLKSNVNLHLERGALLQFSNDKSLYKLVNGFFEGKSALRCQSPITGIGLSKIGITGGGIIDGHGDAWRAMNRSSVTEDEWKKLVDGGGMVSENGNTWYPSSSYAKGASLSASKDNKQAPTAKDYEDAKDFYRPNLLVLNNCKEVLLEGTTFQNSPGWCLHALLCENLTFNDVHVRNEPNAQNGDGMDIESCSYVLVENSTLDCGDDGICIKSGKDEEGRKIGKPSQYIIVRKNTVYKAHGGFVIGSEMSGGAHDIFVSDCTFIGTDNGLRFKTVRGRGGVVQNIFIKNIAMRGIVRDAILFDMYYFTQAPALKDSNGKVDIPAVNAGTPVFRNFYIDGLVCNGADRAMLIRGLPEMNITEIHLRNVSIKSRKGADIIEAQNCTFENIVMNVEDFSLPPIKIENSQQIKLNTFSITSKSTEVLTIGGNRTKNIVLTKVFPLIKSKSISYSYGADASNVKID